MQTISRSKMTLSEKFVFTNPARGKINRTGFTLVELLVVVAIIVILGGAVVGVMGGGGKGQSLDAAVATLRSSINNARSIAMMKGQTAYLIINNEEGSSRYLRFIGVIYENPENAGEWLPANSGQTLPEGIYVITNDVAESSTTGLSGDALSGIKAKVNTAASTFSVNYPTNNSEVIDDAGTQWLAYKFGADGIAQPGTANRKLAVAIGRPTGAGGAVIDEVHQSAYIMISLFGGTITAEYDDL